MNNIQLFKYSGHFMHKIYHQIYSLDIHAQAFSHHVFLPQSLSYPEWFALVLYTASATQDPHSSLLGCLFAYNHNLIQCPLV